MITFDPSKRARALAERGLDFEDAATVFEGRTVTIEDDRFDYGERRFLTYGFLGDRVVMVGWTPRGNDRHVFSMRYCHAREARKIRLLAG